MKGTKIAYWIFTVLLILLMLSSVIGYFMHSPQGAEIMKQLGYPMSVLMLLSIAKILGIIAILIPGFPRLKEWAYAGFAFDLIGALHAEIAIHSPIVDMVGILIGLVLVFGSYFLYHKLNRARQLIV